MALRDWILDSGQVATAIPAIVAIPGPEDVRKIARIATIAIASDEKTENQTAKAVMPKVEWLRPCFICSGHLFTESDRGGYFCCECQPLPEGAKALRIVQGGSPSPEHPNDDLAPLLESPPAQTRKKDVPWTTTGRDWCADHLDELLAAGWTEAELFKETAPHGLALMQLWDDPAATASLEGSNVIFTIEREGKEPLCQTARPMAALLKRKK